MSSGGVDRLEMDARRLPPHYGGEAHTLIADRVKAPGLRIEGHGRTRRLRRRESDGGPLTRKANPYACDSKVYPLTVLAR